MSEFPEIGEKLPEGSEHERERAKFLGITLKRLRFLQWYQPWRRWQREKWEQELERRKSSPSDDRSHEPPVKRSSGTTMFPYDQSEIGRRRAEAAIERVAEVGRQAGIVAQRQIRQARLRAGLPVEPEDDPRQKR